MPTTEFNDLKEQLVCLLLALRYMKILRDAEHPHRSEDLIVQAVSRYRRAVVFATEEQIARDYANTDIDPDSVNRAVRIAQAHAELLNDK